MAFDSFDPTRSDTACEFALAPSEPASATATRSCRRSTMRLGACVLVLALGAAAGALGTSSARATTCSSTVRGVFVEARRDGETVALPRELEQWDNPLYVTPHDSGNGRLSVDADPSPIQLQLRGL